MERQKFPIWCIFCLLLALTKCTFYVIKEMVRGRRILAHPLAFMEHQNLFAIGPLDVPRLFVPRCFT